MHDFQTGVFMGCALDSAERGVKGCYVAGVGPVRGVREDVFVRFETGRKRVEYGLWGGGTEGGGKGKYVGEGLGIG